MRVRRNINQIDLILFNKPYNVLCQFTDSQNRRCLADFSLATQFYACGRLDRDSEGLVILTDNGKLQHVISHPNFKLVKTYWIQVEGCPTDTELEAIRSGILLKDGACKPCRIHIIADPTLTPREPAIRVRKNIPTQWLEIELTEGRNRQIRRMTAAIGFPTLRLYRHTIGQWSCKNMRVGEQRQLQISLADLPSAWQQYMAAPTSSQRRLKPRKKVLSVKPKDHDSNVHRPKPKNRSKC